MKVHGYQAFSVKETVHLGEIIREDGKNISNITNRVNKATGNLAQIMGILKIFRFRVKYF